METLEERARQLVEKMLFGMDVSPSFKENAVSEVVLFGKVQDKFTRHAIAEKLSAESVGFEDISGEITLLENDYLREDVAHRLAMNTSAV